MVGSVRRAPVTHGAHPESARTWDWIRARAGRRAPVEEGVPAAPRTRAARGSASRARHRSPTPSVGRRRDLTMALVHHTLHLGPLDNNTYLLVCERSRSTYCADES